VGLSVLPPGRQQYLLVVAVAGGVGSAVHIGQELGMAEIASLTQGQVEGDRDGWVPGTGHLELGAQHKVGHPLAPIGMRLDGGPIAVVHGGADRRVSHRAVQGDVAKGRYGVAIPVDQGFDKGDTPGDLFSCPTDLVNHVILLQSSRSLFQRGCDSQASSRPGG
jgi:hypothetical protein